MGKMGCSDMGATKHEGWWKDNAVTEWRLWRPPDLANTTPPRKGGGV
jgi:hypothetical protein